MADNGCMISFFQITSYAPGDATPNTTTLHLPHPLTVQDIILPTSSLHVINASLPIFATFLGVYESLATFPLDETIATCPVDLVPRHLWTTEQTPMVVQLPPSTSFTIVIILVICENPGGVDETSTAYDCGLLVNGVRLDDLDWTFSKTPRSYPDFTSVVVTWLSYPTISPITSFEVISERRSTAIVKAKGQNGHLCHRLGVNWSESHAYVSMMLA